MTTIKAIEERVRRKLRHEEQALVKARGEGARRELGEYYIINIRTGGVDASHMDIEKLARELGVL